MILNINKKCKRELLLTKFDLSNNDYDSNQIAAFFQNKILSDIRIDSKFIDVYINFFIYKVKNGSGSEFYKELNENIKKEISLRKDAIYYSGKIQNLYNLIKKYNNEEENEYLVLYLSEKPNNSRFDIEQYVSAIQYKEYIINKIIPSVINLTLNCVIAQDESEKMNISKNLFYGDILLKIVEKSEYFSGFRKKLDFKNNELTFKLSTEEYCNPKKDIVKNGVVVCKKGECKRMDARKTKRLFLSFNDKEYLNSKYSTYLYMYKKLPEVFNILGLNYNDVVFYPGFAFNDFMNIKDMTNSNSTKIIIEKQNYECLNEKYPDDMKNLQSYINKLFGEKSELLVVDNFLKIEMNHNSKYLFIMVRENSKSKNPIEVKIKNTVIGWTTTQSLMVDLNYGEKNLLDEKELDDYTKIKLDNLYKTQQEKQYERPFATQGMIINDKGLGPLNKFGNTVYKSLADLYIKDKLFNNREIKLPKSIFKNIKVLKKESIKVENIKENKSGYLYKKSTKKTINIYSFLSLNRKNSEDDFYINDSFIKISEDKSYPEIFIELFGTDIKKEGKYSEFNNYLILIDNKYLIRVNDKDSTPQIIGDRKIINSDRNPNKLIFDAINDGTLDAILEKRKEAKIAALKCFPKKRAENVDGIISRTTDHEKNLFFPFTMPSFKMVLEDPNLIKTNNGLNNSLALISIEKNIAKFFVRQSEDSISDKMVRSNLMENVAIFSRNEGGAYKESNELETREILSFYLKCMTYNLISSKSVAKKTLLTKMVDILLNN